MEEYTDEWYQRIEDAQGYVELNIEDVSRINGQWSEITAHVEEGDLDNWVMINKVKQTLSEEQDASLRSLLDEDRHIPHDKVLAYQRRAQDRVDELKRRIEEAESAVSEKQTRLLQQRALLESIAPSIKNDLEEVTQGEITKIKDADIADLKKELDSAEVDLDFANLLFERCGYAWPIPDLADVNYEPGENEIFTVDQFPNEREIVSEGIGERVTKKFESRLHDASVHMALLLKEKPGHIWTDEELGSFIYEDNEDEKRNGVRARSLISNYKRGKSPNMSEAIGSDLVLQRGKRQLYDVRTGKSIPRSIKVVWRLVDIETAVMAQTVTTLNSERTRRQSYGEWEPATEHEISLSQIPSGNLDGSPIVTVETGEAATDGSSAASEKQDWRQGFTARAHETIEMLKDEGLMTETTITWKLLRIRSDSKKTGTETMRDRAVKNKIIKPSEATDDSVITMSKAVLAVMQNSHPDIFRVHSRRREAARIVEEILEGYFKARSNES